MIDTIPCDQGCGALIFDFAGPTCADCSILMHRDRMPDDIKALEWDAAMKHLDGVLEISGDRWISLPERVETLTYELKRKTR